MSKKVVQTKHSEMLRVTRGLVLRYSERLGKGRRVGCTVSRKVKEDFGVRESDYIDQYTQFHVELLKARVWERGRKYRIQAVKTSKRLTGPKHTDTLNRISRLTCMISYQRRQKQAEDFILRCD